MCGRYTLSTVDGPEIAQRFSLITPPAEETLGRFNVCPTEPVAAVVDSGQPATAPWGLRPFRNQKYAPINVRSETAAQRFKWLMDGGRCLVLADGWYEWLKAEKKGTQRLPFRYTVDGARRSRSRASTTARALRSSPPRRTRSVRRSTTGCRSCSKGPRRRRRG